MPMTGTIRVAGKKPRLRTSSGWLPPRTAPKAFVSSDGNHRYGPYILAATTDGEVRRVRWWDANSDGETRFCNFLGDCGNAFTVEAWQHLPAFDGHFSDGPDR